MGEEGEGSFSLRLEEDESSQVVEQARLIERGLEALDVDCRIERALCESAGSRHTGGASGSRVTMGVIPEKGALNGISVSNEPMGARVVSSPDCTFQAKVSLVTNDIILRFC